MNSTIRSLLVLLLVASCSTDDPDSRWVHLAEGFVPETRIAPGEPWLEAAIGGERLVLDPEEGGNGVWVSALLAADAWEVAPFGTSVWRARRPLWGVGLPEKSGQEPQRLESAGAVFDFVPFTVELVQRSLEPGTFTGVVEFVYLKTDGEPPPDCTYITFVERGRSVNGRWRVGLERFQCDGIPLWPGQTEELTIDVPEASALYFRTAGVGTAQHLGQVAGHITFRVLLDGEELASYEQPVADLPRAEHRVLELPPERREGARLRFEATTGFVRKKSFSRRRTTIGRSTMFVASTIDAHCTRPADSHAHSERTAPWLRWFVLMGSFLRLQVITYLGRKKSPPSPELMSRVSRRMPSSSMRKSTSRTPRSLYRAVMPESGLIPNLSPLTATASSKVAPPSFDRLIQTWPFSPSPGSSPESFREDQNTNTFSFRSAATAGDVRPLRPPERSSCSPNALASRSSRA